MATDHGVKINSGHLEKLMIQLDTAFKSGADYDLKSEWITVIVKNLWLLIKLFRTHHIPIDDQLMKTINNQDWFGITEFLIL